MSIEHNSGEQLLEPLPEHVQSVCFTFTHGLTWASQARILVPYDSQSRLAHALKSAPKFPVNFRAMSRLGSFSESNYVYLSQPYTSAVLRLVR